MGLIHPNALVKGSKAEAANYPFCTIEPNVGIVEVPDERLAPLAEVSKSKKIYDYRDSKILYLEKLFKKRESYYRKNF